MQPDFHHGRLAPGLLSACAVSVGPTGHESVTRSARGKTGELSVQCHEECAGSSTSDPANGTSWCHTARMIRASSFATAIVALLWPRRSAVWRFLRSEI